MKILLLFFLATLAMIFVACANGDDTVPSDFVQENSSPVRISSISATPVPEIPESVVTTATLQPTPQNFQWDSCFGIPREEGSELIAVGENYCIVESTLSVQVAIWPPSISEAPDTANLAAKDLEDPCSEKVVYFFSNLPELEFPKVHVKKYVCDN